MNILITGGGGYIAKSLYNALKHTHKVTCVSRKDFDLSDSSQTIKYFSNKQFDIVLHCAVSGGSRLRPDKIDDLDNNLSMYYNLLHCGDKFKKLINFSSGAEVTASESLYGLSKRVITKSVAEKEYYNNVKIFAVFDDNELDTRFIKGCISRYINREPMIIHQNKYMDFFYMKDLVALVDTYIQADYSMEDVDCTYETSPTLLEVAQYINTLDNYTVDIQIQTDGMATPYTGHPINTKIPLIGLKEGINEVYTILKNKR